jgi:hypothetical protein
MQLVSEQGLVICNWDYEEIQDNTNLLEEKICDPAGFLPTSASREMKVTVVFKSQTAIDARYDIELLVCPIPIRSRPVRVTVWDKVVLVPTWETTLRLNFLERVQDLYPADGSSLEGALKNDFPTEFNVKKTLIFHDGSIKKEI